MNSSSWYKCLNLTNIYFYKNLKSFQRQYNYKYNLGQNLNNFKSYLFFRTSMECTKKLTLFVNLPMIFVVVLRFEIGYSVLITHVDT